MDKRNPTYLNTVSHDKLAATKDLLGSFYSGEISPEDILTLELTAMEITSLDKVTCGDLPAGWADILPDLRAIAALAEFEADNAPFTDNAPPDDLKDDIKRAIRFQSHPISGDSFRRRNIYRGIAIAAALAGAIFLLSIFTTRVDKTTESKLVAGNNVENIVTSPKEPEISPATTPYIEAVDTKQPGKTSQPPKSILPIGRKNKQIAHASSDSETVNANDTEEISRDDVIKLLADAGFDYSENSRYLDEASLQNDEIPSEHQNFSISPVTESDIAGPTLVSMQLAAQETMADVRDVLAAINEELLLGSNNVNNVINILNTIY